MAAIESTTPKAASAAIGVIAVLVEATGIELPVFAWSLVGAGFTQAFSEQEISRKRVILQLALSCLVGAAITSAAAQYAAVTNVHFVRLLAVLAGAFAQPLLQAGLNKLMEKINAI